MRDPRLPPGDNLLTCHDRGTTAVKLYNKRLKEYEEEPAVFSFTFLDDQGRRSNYLVPRRAMSLAQGVTISNTMMDAACGGLLHASDLQSKGKSGLGKRFILTSKAYTHVATDSILDEPPPVPGWTIMPICPEGAWSLLVGEHLGGKDEL